MIEDAFPMLDWEREPLAFTTSSSRFELGGEFENGSVARVDQASFRAMTLWQDVFTNSKELTLIIDDWDTSEPQLWPTVPSRFLYSLINDSKVLESSACSIDSENLTQKRLLVRFLPETFDHASMLRGIAAKEQGMQPSVGQRIYCLDTQNNIAFNMYDDRGCLIYFRDQRQRQTVSEKRPNWLVAGR